MSAHEPPATVTLRFCAECGDMFLSQHEPHRPPAYHYNPVGGRPCRGATAALTYELRAEPQRCALCGAGAGGRCELPDDEDECPHGCSPER